MALTREQKLQKKKDYYYANRKVVLERNRQYYIKHKEAIARKRKEYHKKYYEKNKDSIIKRTNGYNKSHRELVAFWSRERRKREETWVKVRASEDKYRRRKMSTDICFKLGERMSGAVRQALRGKKRGKSIEPLIGCSLLELKEHLERMFSGEMNWDNHGNYWHIDHIIPKSYFFYDNTEDEEFSLCWNYTNLQPMRAEDNQRKSNKYIG